MDTPPGDLQVTRQGEVLTVALDRPERRNALDADSARRLTQLLEDSRADRATRAIVITGSGRDFCTGADVARISEAAERTPLEYRFGPEVYRRLFQQLWETETPVVSAVNGTVAGIGWMLGLLADLVVGKEDARWTHVFTRRGMVPHAGDPYFLSRLIPFHLLHEIALLSEPIETSRLHEWHLVNRSVPEAEVLPTAQELASRLAQGPTRSLGLAKQLYRRALDQDMTAAFHDERAALALISTTKDREEGVRSFMEQRRPDFTGE